MANSSLRPSMGNPFAAFEDSAAFALLPFLSGPATRCGAAIVAAVKTKIAMIPASERCRVMPESDFKGGAFLIFPSPLAEVSPGTAGVVAVNSRTQFNPMKKEKLRSEVNRALTVRRVNQL